MSLMKLPEGQKQKSSEDSFDAPRASNRYEAISMMKNDKRGSREHTSFNTVTAMDKWEEEVSTVVDRAWEYLDPTSKPLFGIDIGAPQMQNHPHGNGCGHCGYRFMSGWQIKERRMIWNELQILRKLEIEDAAKLEIWQNEKTAITVNDYK